MNEEYTSSVDVFALGLVYLAVLQYKMIKKSEKLLKPVAEGILVNTVVPIGQTMSFAIQSKVPVKPVCPTTGSSAAETTIRKLIVSMTCARSEERLKALQVKQVMEQLDDYPNIEAVVPNVNKSSSRFQSYDIVQISNDKSMVKSLQTGSQYDPWNDKMKMSLGIKGVVDYTGQNGEVHVQCINGYNLAINPVLLVKVDTSDLEIEKNDVVLINHNKKQVKTLQEQIGGWNTDMDNCLGCTGIAKKVLSGNRVKVEVGSDLWIFCKDALKVVAKSDELMSEMLKQMVTDYITSSSKKDP